MVRFEEDWLHTLERAIWKEKEAKPAQLEKGGGTRWRKGLEELLYLKDFSSHATQGQNRTIY
jgi:hypothetical protein